MPCKRKFTFLMAALLCVLNFAAYGQKDVVSELFYTGDNTPGDIRNGIDRLEHFYKYIQIYRTRHQGSYQNKSGLFMKDVLDSPQEYGFKSFDEANVALSNPDDQYNDLAYIRRNPQRMLAATLWTNRPDGVPLGEPKLNGTQDVLAFAKTYYHRNPPAHAVGREIAQPSRFLSRAI